MLEPNDQVNGDGKVQNQSSDLQRADFPDQLVNFQRDKGERNDDREVFRPPLAHEQTDTFDHKKDAI